MTKRAGDEINVAFDRVVNAFVTDRDVTRGGGKGFGSGALQVNGKIFAMMSSQSKLVVKLRRERVDALVASGGGERFEPGPGRLMREWVVIGPEASDWVALACEARDFVKRGM